MLLASLPIGTVYYWPAYT